MHNNTRKREKERGGKQRRVFLHRQILPQTTEIPLLRRPLPLSISPFFALLWFVQKAILLKMRWVVDDDEGVTIGTFSWHAIPSGSKIEEKRCLNLNLLQLWSLHWQDNIFISTRYVNNLLLIVCFDVSLPESRQIWRRITQPMGELFLKQFFSTKATKRFSAKFIVPKIVYCPLPLLPLYFPPLLGLTD